VYKVPHAHAVESLSARTQKRQHYEDVQHRQRQNTASRQEERDNDSRQSHEESRRLHASTLGVFPTVCQRNRPPARSADEWRGRGVLRALRWSMARVADQGVSLRRPTKILRAIRSDPMETDQGGHRTTTERVADVQGGCQQAASRQPDRRQLHPMLPEPGPRHSGTHRRVLRVQSVSFDVRVTVYPLDDYDRRSPWMHTATDRLRFKRIIRQTELILAPILSREHRCLILLRRLDMSSDNI